MHRIDHSHRLCANCRSLLLGQFAGLFTESNALAADANASTGAMKIDLEEQAAGYKVAYSKLALAGTPAQNVVAYPGDVRVHAARGVHAVA